MMYKIAYEGYNVVEVEADTIEQAEEAFWERGLNDLYNAEIREIVPVGQPFKDYTDLNE